MKRIMIMESALISMISTKITIWESNPTLTLTKSCKKKRNIFDCFLIKYVEIT